MKKKIYVGCAINNLTPEQKAVFFKEVNAVKAELNKDFEVLEFIGDAAAPAEKIYDWDINGCVYKADFMLAICDHPSLGLGYEMGTAIEKCGIPVLAVAHATSSVSRLIIGISGKDFSFRRYEKVSDIAGMVREAFLVLTRKQSK